MKTSARNQQIDAILQDLRGFPKTSENEYAIEKNIEFFEAARSFPHFIVWVLTKMSKLDRKRLLEINDILPKWDKEMHIKLMEVEKRKFPGLIEPLVENIVEYIKKENRTLTLADIGFGGMETERQVIERLIAYNCKQPVIFIGVDQSPSAHEIAKENLSIFKDKIRYNTIDQLTYLILEDMRKSNTGITVIACRNDIFNLDKTFKQNDLDLSYHSLFKHHLNEQQKKELDRILNLTSKKVLEYDGFRSNIAIIPQIKNGWGYPAFLNAAIFSNLRFDKAKDLALSSKDKNKVISFFKQRGTYILR